VLAALPLAIAARAGPGDAIKARLWLDGPLQPEGRAASEARRLFLEMSGVALRAPPIGPSLDAAPAFDRLGEIAVPSLVI
jgi:hypothetical protein